jgi:hypothetical protein
MIIWENNLNLCIEKCGMVSLTTGIMFLLFMCMYFWAWGILQRWSACAPTAYEVVRECLKFEKYSFIPSGNNIYLSYLNNP